MTKAGNGRLGYRIAASLAIAALLLHIAMPPGQSQARPAAGAWAEAYIVICSALGVRTIPNPDAPQDSETPYSCPACQISNPAKVLAPDMPDIAIVRALQSGPGYGPQDELRLAATNGGAVYARGPPLG